MGEDSLLQQYGTTFAIGAVVVLLLLTLLRGRSNKDLKRLPPGPKPWPIIGNLNEMGQMNHLGMANISKKYGSPLIHLWLGSVHLIVANSMETAKQILKVQDANWASRPILTPLSILSYNNQSVSAAPYGPLWRKVRKVYVLELLTATRMKSFQPERVEEIKEAVWTLLEESNGKKAVQIEPKVKDHLTNIVTRIIMSKRYFGTHASTDASAKFQESVRQSLVLLGLFHLGDYIPLFKHWDVQRNKKNMKEAHALIDAFLQKMVDERKQQIAEKRNTGDTEFQEKGDFLDVLLNRSGDKDDIKITDEIIKGIIQDTILGGVGSSASSVEWTLSEILRHPKILKKLQDELDITVGRERLVAEEDISKLPYLQAVVKESFRMHPATPMLIPRISLEACEIEGYYIPAGTHAFVNVWAIGQDSEVWENPQDFNPDRFLGNPIDVIGANFELLPFGSGRRKCPGINLGVIFVQYVLAVLLQNCDWSFPPGKTPDTFDMREGVGIVNHRIERLAAIVTRRLPRHILAPAT
ncbi:unnamed protein product [Calypogeia fissa]